MLNAVHVRSLTNCPCSDNPFWCLVGEIARFLSLTFVRISRCLKIHHCRTNLWKIWYFSRLLRTVYLFWSFNKGGFTKVKVFVAFWAIDIESTAIQYRGLLYSFWNSWNALFHWEFPWEWQWNMVEYKHVLDIIFCFRYMHLPWLCEKCYFIVDPGEVLENTWKQKFPVRFDRVTCLCRSRASLSDPLQELDYEERMKRAAFFQELVLSTILF